MDASFESLFDKRNEWVRHCLNSKYTCNFINNRLHHIDYNFDENKLNILVPKDCKIERLTQELIRIYLQSEGILIKDYLVQLFYQEALLNWTFTENTFLNIGHALEDFKILPLFLKSGFSKDQFSISHGMDSVSQFHQNRIVLGFDGPTPLRHSIELYIFKFFSIKWGAVYNEESLDFYKQLKLLNNDLYEILERFYNHWFGFDVARFDPNIYSYSFFSQKFVHELGVWTIKLLYSGSREN